jgi:leader peptidase (prepilin peptidase) / N-methyltransferase
MHTGCKIAIGLLVELLSGGANLPNRSVNSYAGVLWIILYTKWDLVGLYLFHCFLFCTLLTWMLMTKDGNRIPVRLIVFSFSISIFAPIVFPNLVLVPIWKPLPASLSGWVGIALHVLLGAIVGIVGGFAAGRFARLILRPSKEPEWILALCAAMAGSVLGWQAAIVSITLFTGLALLMAISSGQEKARSPWVLVGILSLAILVHHLTWRIHWAFLFS